MQDLTILVNTSDSFEDCWNPFFTLFARYWPDCPYPIVLNTETKDFGFPGLNITASRVAAGEPRRLTWSQCLARCLDSIETPYVFYLQEDYFLEAPVKAAQFESLLAEMRAGYADVIRIMECGGSGPWYPTDNPMLWAVDRQAKYRIALQAALWLRDVLRSHIRDHESPWQLEAFGSARASRRQGEKVLCVNRDQFHGPGKEIFPYTPTGVVSGRWERHVVEPLFATHGINMDYSIRGFYDPLSSPKKKRPLLSRITDRVRSLV